MLKYTSVLFQSSGNHKLTNIQVNIQFNQYKATLIAHVN